VVAGSSPVRVASLSRPYFAAGFFLGCGWFAADAWAFFLAGPSIGWTRHVEAAVCGIPGVSQLSDMRVSGHALQDKLLGRFFRGN
jgi:hypothetical protein